MTIITQPAGVRITKKTAIRFIAYGITANLKGKGQIMGTTAELQAALKKAYSIENMTGHGAEGKSVTYIGVVARENRIYSIYRDSSGDYWYKTEIRTPQGIVSEYEAIFGKPERKGVYRKWK